MQKKISVKIKCLFLHMQNITCKHVCATCVYTHNAWSDCDEQSQTLYHTKTLANASAPALAKKGRDEWNATAYIDSSHFLRWDVISCTQVLLSKFHKRIELSWPVNNIKTLIMWKKKLWQKTWKRKFLCTFLKHDSLCKVALKF